jgi:hypothetical protein
MKNGAVKTPSKALEFNLLEPKSIWARQNENGRAKIISAPID